MKKILVAIVMILSPMISVTQAALDRSTLPESSHYSGQHDRSFDLGSEGVLDIHLEFAVYSHLDEVEFEDGTITNEAQIMQDWTEYTGDADYVYAYQVFCEESSTAALSYFSLTGIDPATIASVEDDIHQQDQLNDTYFSNGIQPEGDGGYFDDSGTKAIWEFGDGSGAIAQGEQSWFLFLYSDSDWIAGDIEVQPALADDDIPVPEVPEPATLFLLTCGAAFSLKRRKKHAGA